MTMQNFNTTKRKLTPFKAANWQSVVSSLNHSFALLLALFFEHLSFFFFFFSFKENLDQGIQMTKKAGDKKLHSIWMTELNLSQFAIFLSLTDYRCQVCSSNSYYNINWHFPVPLFYHDYYINKENIEFSDFIIGCLRLHTDIALITNGFPITRRAQAIT